MARALDPELLAEARRIQIRADRMVTDVMSGGYSSVFRGSGIEFDEVREFAEGDDLRSVDWNVTARVGRPFVKKFVEERELTVLFVLDVSASMAFGTTPLGAPARRTVAATAALFVGCVAFAAARNNDKAGLIRAASLGRPLRAGEEGQEARAAADPRSVRAAGGRGRWRPGCGARLRRSCAAPPRDRVRGQRLPDRGRARCRGVGPALRRLAQRHDVIAVRIRDPFAAGLDRAAGDVAALPALGLCDFVDPETGRTVTVDVASRAVRATIRANWQAERQALLSTCRRAGVDLLDVPTDGSVVDPLVRFFRMRERRGAKR